MFSGNIEEFIISNIYLLIVINLALLIAIYYEIIKNNMGKSKYNKALKELEPIIVSYIKEKKNFNKIKSKIKKDFNKIVAIDIINSYSEENNINLSETIKALELDLFLINKIKNKPNIKYLKKLAFMRVDSAYELLLKYSDSEDLDIKYTSYFGLATLNVEKEKKYFIVHKLVKSDILSDRIIEILNRVEMNFIEWLDILEAEESEVGKIIFLKNLLGKKELLKEENSDRITKFLYDKKEIRIAAVATICSSKNEKYIDELYTIFKNEQEWEVRVAITKGMSNFDPKFTKDKLLYMIKDKEWWVRFNAAKAISLMGEEGIYMLIDLSIDKSNENTSDLAYYFLNSNKDIYETVKNIEG